MKRILSLILILSLLITPIIYAAWDATEPAATSKPATSQPVIKANWDSIADGSVPQQGTSYVDFDVDSDMTDGPAATISKTGIVFEGTTGDAYETTFSITDPTADRTITFLNETGTVLTTGTTRFYVGSFTRDTATASGTQAVTGVGFQPKAIIFLANQALSREMSWGFDDDTTSLDIHDDVATADTYTNETYAIYDEETNGGNVYTGTISSFDSDGFTMNWTRTATPTGTLTIVYIAFR